MWKLLQGGKRATAQTARYVSGFSALAPRSLDSILKLNTVRHATPEEVVSLWNKYHSGRGLVSAVINKEQFNTIQHRAKTCPFFVVPLQEENGYTSFFLQAQMPHLLFTGLEDYKMRGTNASPYLTLAHYTELADSKGLVLVRGDIVFPSKLSDIQAKKLMDISHSFFLHDSRFSIVEDFNKNSADFEFQDVLKELNISAGP
ncbi:hypothetical protein GOP47_0007724 [Adiantum capillus-veneris]|uniref:ATP synthase mitochondrial F1 complex assembly factor 1 n=1 Tax=Adiantum capillus-veneris TaxID=13818 RepID=A0A9D4V1U1_ADICA|nr:hypothetical protein GOP47_0007724 [Adiantum capillus-veneris]